ncbi:SEC-C metal-binding domain-containing protein [Psychrobacter cibarius]|nr:SEC-C metal-binding domain-containing protein [Psychrobacter cibarius]
MNVPAVCDNCGNIFPSGFSAINSTNISFSNCRAGPCPVCGGKGHIPDGVYNSIGNTIEFLSGPERSLIELKKLASILERAKNNNFDSKSIGREVDEEIPELSSIKDLLPTNRSELYGFITILLTIISLIMSQTQSSSSSKIEINTVINNVYYPTSEAQSSNSSTPKVKAEKKIGRNELCTCGSGKKFKKCCLP